MERKQRVKLAIMHREADMIPYCIWYTPPIKELLQKHYGTKDVDEAMGNHILIVKGKGRRPMYANPQIYGDLTEDEFGVVWRNTPYDRGSVYKYPLREPSLERYEFPDPKQPGKFDRIAGIFEAKPDVFTVGDVGDLWERCYFMMEYPALIKALFTAPEFVEELLDRITEYDLATMDELSRFPIDGILLSDDYGHQHGMQMSLAHWRRFIKPRLKRIFERAKRHGLYTFLHSDGDITAILPDLIEIGLDVINPVQPEAMDPYQVKKQFGDNLCIWGAIGTQRLLNRGRPDDIRREIRRAKRELGQGGGYILGPAINLQRDCPLENVLAFIDEARSSPR